ncbi:MAG: hypothetical protein NTX97_11120, partial [Bacteroidetes bacterium]|nr:hypothetical protein [Bacteroidota bacterium]
LSKKPPLLNWIPLIENEAMELNLSKLLLKKIYRKFKGAINKNRNINSQLPQVKSSVELFPVKIFQW